MSGCIDSAAPVSEASSTPLRPWAVALAGLLSLAVAMGIGRFAFTPLLPMMLKDGSVTLAQASGLATANYLGYWLGAMACALQPALWARWRPGRPLRHTTAVRTGLVLTVLLTLAMALPFGGWGWRFAAGLASALVFVYISGWCLARLALLNAPALAGIIYVGPGLGITLSGLLASGMVAWGWPAAAGWLAFGVLALGLTALVWPRLQGTVPAPAVAAAPMGGLGQAGQVGGFTVAYGLAGFGYIITATFLPVIARQVMPGSIWIDLFWPLFGLGVAAGALLTVRLPVRWDRRWLLLACYLMQALGVALTVWWPQVAGFALGSLLLGLPFTAITLFAMQEVRKRWPGQASSMMSVVTSGWGLGQIAGPPLVGWLLQQGAGTAQGFRTGLQAAVAALLLGAAMFGLWAWRQPQE